jgi:SAM-dependent methyltransferase
MTGDYSPVLPPSHAQSHREPPPEEFARLHPFRSRGLASLERNVGGVLDVVRELLAGRERLRILELGCGYCTALVELEATFGDRVELHGINKRPWHGSWATARASVAKLGLMSEDEFDRLARPTLYYHDLDEPLPLPDDSFDLVFSQLSFVYYRRKAEVLEEVNRVLAPGGLAKLDVLADRTDLPVEYARSFEIWERGRSVDFWEYAARFETLVRRLAMGKPYLEMRKAPSLRLGLEFVAAVDLKRIHTEWWGTKSVYRAASIPA